MTGFTTRGEEEEGVLDIIKGWNIPTIETSAASSGAICKFSLFLSHFPMLEAVLTYPDVPPAGPWDAFTIIDGRIVTGANPVSAHVTAEDAVKAFDAL